MLCANVCFVCYGQTIGDGNSDGIGVGNARSAFARSPHRRRRRRQLISNRCAVASMRIVGPARRARCRDAPLEVQLVIVGDLCAQTNEHIRSHSKKVSRKRGEPPLAASSRSPFIAAPPTPLPVSHTIIVDAVESSDDFRFSLPLYIPQLTSAFRVNFVLQLIDFAAQNQRISAAIHFASIEGFLHNACP